MTYFSYQWHFMSLLGPRGHRRNEETASAHLIEHGKVLVQIWKFRAQEWWTALDKHWSAVIVFLCSIVTPALMVRIFHLKRVMVYEIACSLLMQVFPCARLYSFLADTGLVYLHHWPEELHSTELSVHPRKLTRCGTPLWDYKTIILCLHLCTGKEKTANTQQVHIKAA